MFYVSVWLQFVNSFYTNIWILYRVSRYSSRHIVMTIFSVRGYECWVVEGRVRQDVNVALRRPAWQSSTWCDRLGCFGAHYSNDGNTSTQFYAHFTCSATRYQLYPWWAVDLGSPLYVDGVNFTNRGDCCGGCRLKQLHLSSLSSHFSLFITYK